MLFHLSESHVCKQYSGVLRLPTCGSFFSVMNMFFKVHFYIWKPLLTFKAAWLLKDNYIKFEY